jgi:hypothetical protein
MNLLSPVANVDRRQRTLRARTSTPRYKGTPFLWGQRVTPVFLLSPGHDGGVAPLEEQGVAQERQSARRSSPPRWPARADLARFDAMRLKGSQQGVHQDQETRERAGQGRQEAAQRQARRAGGGARCAPGHAGQGRARRPKAQGAIRPGRGAQDPAGVLRSVRGAVRSPWPDVRARARPRSSGVRPRTPSSGSAVLLMMAPMR